MVNVDELKSKINLIDLCANDTTLKRKGAREFCAPCPFCGGRDRFNVQSDKWLCRNCTQGKWQDAIAYVMRRESCDFVRACELLGAADTLPQRARVIVPTPDPTEPAHEWQDAARLVIAQAVDSLWNGNGTKALEYLHKRGLNDDTLRQWRIGYLPGTPSEWRNVNGLRVPCGIVIPCEIGDAVWYVKVRRSHDAPKYEQIAGGRSALFGADTLANKSAAILTEGEFDAMLLAQVCGDLVGVATMGSASASPSDAMMRYLLPCASWLVAYDLDDAGANGAQWWLHKSERARRVYVPQIAEHVKDVSDYHNAGGNLREWVLFQTGSDETMAKKKKSSGGVLAELQTLWDALLDKAATFANDDPQRDAVLDDWRKVDDKLKARLDAAQVMQAIKRG